MIDCGGGKNGSGSHAKLRRRDFPQRQEQRRHQQPRRRARLLQAGTEPPEPAARPLSRGKLPREMTKAAAAS